MTLAAQLRNKVMNHITRLSLDRLPQDNKARFARIITADVGLIVQLAVTIGAPAIVALPVPATIIVVTLFVNWKIGILFLAVMPAALLVLRWGARISAEEEKKLEKAATDIAGKAYRTGTGAKPCCGRPVKVRQVLSYCSRYWKSTGWYTAKGLQRATLPFLSFIGAVTAGFIAIILLITFLFIEASFSASEAIVLFILAVRFLEPLGYLTELIGALEAMDNAMGRVQELLQTPALQMAKAPIREIKDTAIELDQISFAYGDTPVIENISFHCPQGSTTALIGASGSGKTTLIRLIARFYDVNKGSIKIGGTDIRQLDYDTMMNDIAIIFQDVYLFDTTIKENLLIAKPDATEAALKEAATAAQLTEMLERLPLGWDTKVGEGGMQLSGGERQRVSIARAFFEKSPYRTDR